MLMTIFSPSGEESEQQEQQKEDDKEDRGQEWTWVSAILEEVYASVVGVGDKVINSSSQIIKDTPLAINITPSSTPTSGSSKAATPLGISPLPLGKPTKNTSFIL